MPLPVPLPLPLPVSGRYTETAPDVAQVGGKNAGIALLARVGGLALPEPRLALTVQAYARHLRSLRARIDALLATPDLRRVAERWLRERNADLPPERAGARVTLDVEFRTMAGAWPDGDVARPDRVVIKQVRPLIAAAPLPELEALQLPIPAHIARRAERVVEVSCRGPGLRVDFMEVEVPGADAAFVPYLQMAAQGNSQADAQKAEVRWTHLAFGQPRAGRFALGEGAAARLGLDAIDTAALACQRTTALGARAAMLRALEVQAVDLGAAPAGNPAPTPGAAP